MKIEQNISLRQFSTFKVGGNADYFCRISSIDDLKQAINFSRQNSLGIFVLGGGSNILVSDSGFRGLVIKIEIKGVSYENEKIIAGAGESWDEIVKLSIENKLYGIENLSFIPGTVGGAVAGNIGAYGVEIKDKIEWVEIFDTQSLKTIILNKEQCEFSYRDSIFKKPEAKNYIITKVCLKLSYNEKPNLSYKDVKEYFENTNIPTLKEIRRAIGSIRSKKLLNIEAFGMAGSFFKNPIIDGNKIYLARELEHLGMKGLREGNVGVSPKQPLVIINYGNASAKEIKNFSEKIAREVFNKLKIKITPEIIFVGKF